MNTSSNTSILKTELPTTTCKRLEKLLVLSTREARIKSLITHFRVTQIPLTSYFVELDVRDSLVILGNTNDVNTTFKFFPNIRSICIKSTLENTFLSCGINLSFINSTDDLSEDRMNKELLFGSCVRICNNNIKALWETVTNNCGKFNTINLSLGLNTTDTSSGIISVSHAVVYSVTLSLVSTVYVLGVAVTKSVSTLEVTITDSECKSYGSWHWLNTNRLIAHKSRIDTTNHRKDGRWVSHVTRSIEVAVTKFTTMKTVLRTEHCCGHCRAVLIEPAHLVLKKHSSVVTNILVTNRSETSSTLKEFRPVLYCLAGTLTVFLCLRKLRSASSNLSSTL